MRKSIAAVVLIFAACAHNTPAPPRTPPPWTSIPAVVSDDICQRVRTEGIDTRTPIAVITTTAPIVNGAAIEALAQAYAVVFGGSAQLAGSIAPLLKEMPVNVPASGNGSCNFKAVSPADQRRVTDVLVLQLSSPMLNPFSKKESGLFARLSLAGHDATWYWVPVAEKKGQWLIGNVIPLAAHED